MILEDGADVAAAAAAAWKVWRVLHTFEIRGGGRGNPAGF